MYICIYIYIYAEEPGMEPISRHELCLRGLTTYAIVARREDAA